MNLDLLTERLSLRPFHADDLDLCLELFTDPVITRYADGPLSKSEIRNEIPNWEKRGGNGCIGIWCIADRLSGEKYGSVALLPIPVEEDDTDFDLVVPGQMPDGDIEIGYFLRRPAWGRGIATEACAGILRFAFENSPLDEVVATLEEENAASVRVLEKSGFRLHGTRRCYGDDGPDYRLSRDEWTKMAPA